MKQSDRIISSLITFAMAAVFVFAAAYFALHYNRWFVREESQAESIVSFSDVHGSKVVLKMDQSSVSKGISNEALEELNIYGFPVGESPYFIYVEKGAHTLSVFEKDGYGLYTKRVYTWITATGKTNLLTPVGTFAVGAKEEWHRWPAHTYSPYATKYYENNNIYKGLFIHGPIYQNQTFSSLLNGTALQIGTNCSSGCLRTETEAAYFIYELCPEGTMVKIVEGSPLGFAPDRQVYIYNQSITPSLDRFLYPSKELEDISFSEEKHTMTLGEQYTPEIIFNPDDAGYIDLNWTTNNPAIVKISGGSIWAVGTGSAILTVTTKDNNLSASMLINVIVHNVDTSEAPPDVGGRMEEDNSRINDDYQPISESLLYLTINGEKFAINQNVRTLLKNLGSNYIQMNPAQSCAYDGYDRFFVYYYMYNGSCSISTVPMLADGGDAICEIEFKNYTDAKLESSKGIKIGDSFEEVVKAYGNFYTEVRVDDEKHPSKSFIRITYWAGKANDPGVPSLYFTLDPETKNVKGMGIYSARNMG
ncbi:MAG: L,D-transpeptidase family protein [Clostridia bacterium]|nr:L,D-transpeptidase family protein [Clostridia bacterium]